MNFYFWKMMGVGKGIVSGNKNFVNLLSHQRLYFHKHQDILIIFCDEKQICGKCISEKNDSMNLISILQRNKVLRRFLSSNIL